MFNAQTKQLAERVDGLEAAVEGIRGDLSRISEAIENVQIPAIQPYDDTEVRQALAQVEQELSTRMHELRSAVAEGIERADRQERRIKATVQRARREFQEGGFEHGGVEAEWADLRGSDGGGGSEEGVQPVREEVGSAPTFAGPPPIPGEITSEDYEALIRRAGNASTA